MLNFPRRESECGRQKNVDTFTCAKNLKKNLSKLKEQRIDKNKSNEHKSFYRFNESVKRKQKKMKTKSEKFVNDFRAKRKGKKG